MNTSPFSLANRKQLADLLKDSYEGLRHKTKQKWNTKAEGLRKSMIEEYAEKKGALPLLRQIEANHKKIEELELEIQQLGFEWSCRRLGLHGGSSNPLDDIIDARIEKEIGSRDAIDARFDSAQIAMMTIATLEDADKLLKSVSEL